MRLVRPSIVLLCGPAACGKSTFAQRHFRPTQVISSDWARGCVCDDERDQRFQTQAFALIHHLAELRLSLNRLCVIDSTALTAPHRREYLELAKRFQVPCVVILFDVPLEKCVERDHSRPRTVGRPVIERQYLAFGQTKTEIRQEGFQEVIELGDEDMDKVQIEIVFRPISQPTAIPAGRPHSEARPAPRPWQQRTGRGPGAREARLPSPTHPATRSIGEAKPEVRPVGTTPKVVPAPATAPSPASNVDGSAAPAQRPVSPAQNTAQATPDEAPKPPAASQAEPGGQSE